MLFASVIQKLHLSTIETLVDLDQPRPRKQDACVQWKCEILFLERPFFQQTWIDRTFYQKIPGETANDASLDDELDFLGLIPKMKVRDAMKWQSPPYCYTCKSPNLVLLCRGYRLGIDGVWYHSC